MRKPAKDMWQEERAIQKNRSLLIGGIDEAGRGPLAGPVVASCVILPFEHPLEGVDDSKKLTENQREMAYHKILNCAVSVGIGIVPPERIDEINILRATREAMIYAVEDTVVKPDVVLIDGLPVKSFPIPQIPLVKGDSRSMSVAAASIIAKVTRDRIMLDMDHQYPGYGFARHKGYPTADHLEALERLGVCEIHRKSFAPVARLLEFHSHPSNPIQRSLWEDVHELGSSGEKIAEEHLLRIGWNVLERNYRSKEGEIDLIAMEGETIVFVEVKARRGRHSEPSEAVDLRKRRRICVTAEEWLATHNRSESPCRFDVAEVRFGENGEASVNIIQSAFMAGE